MKLLSTSFFAGIITFIKVVSGFVAGKLIAVYTGAPGVALIGALTNFINISLTISSGAISTGVIKYTAEFKNDSEKLTELFSTAIRITLICSAVTAFILVCFSENLSQLIFSDIHYSTLIKIFGVTVGFYAINSLLIAILNGLGEIKDYTIVNSAGSIVGLILTIILVYFFKLEGALYSLILAQSVVFFITLSLTYKNVRLKIKNFKSNFNSNVAVKLSHYSLMTIVSAITAPIVQIMIRKIIVSDSNINSAGYWQGLMRISDGYLMLITTALGTYYLPKLSSLVSKEELRNEILFGYKLILPFVIISTLFIYYSRFQIISLLFTKDFLVMEKLFFWQLIGDIFKIASWLLSYLLLAKAMVKVFILLEIIFSITYLIFSYFLIKKYHLEGVTIAFTLNYIFYSIVLVVIFWNSIFRLDKIK